VCSSLIYHFSFHMLRRAYSKSKLHFPLEEDTKAAVMFQKSFILSHCCVCKSYLTELYWPLSVWKSQWVSGEEGQAKENTVCLLLKCFGKIPTLKLQLYWFAYGRNERYFAFELAPWPLDHKLSLLFVVRKNLFAP